MTVPPTYEFQAKKFPEVELIMLEGDIHKGKIISLRGEDLLFSPFPYWNVDLLKISLDGIYSIKLIKRGSKIGKGASFGFALSFIVIGAIAGAYAKYDEDYEEALLGSAVSGAVGGLLGVAIGGIAEAATKSKYELHKMPDSKKAEAVKKIIGY